MDHPPGPTQDTPPAAPARRPRPPRWRALRAVLALFLGGVSAASGLDSLLTDAQGHPARSGAPNLRVDFDLTEDPDPLRALSSALAADYALGRLDVASARAHLIEHRGDIQAQLVSRAVERRTPWLWRAERWLNGLGAWLVLVLLGPAVLLFSMPPSPDRWRRAAAAIPAFVVATAVCLFMFDFMVGTLMLVQSAQMTLGAFGTPAAATTDAAVQFLVSADDAELEQLVQRLVTARAQLGSDPAGAFGLVEHLWRGAEEAQQSRLWRTAADVLSWSGVALDGYLLALVVAAAILTITLIVPVMVGLVRQPWEAARSPEGARAWPLVVQQFRLIWRELRIFGWLLLFLTVTTVIAVVALRAVSYPVVVAALRTLLAAEALLDAGAALPDLPLLLAVLALTVVGIGASLGLAAPVGAILTKAQLVLRERARSRRKFRDFPAFWRVVRGLGRRVVLPTIGATIAAFGLFFAATWVIDAPGARIWLPTATVAPTFTLVAWRLHILREFWRLVRVDVLAPAATQNPT